MKDWHEIDHHIQKNFRHNASHEAMENRSMTRPAAAGEGALAHQGRDLRCSRHPRPWRPTSARPVQPVPRTRRSSHAAPLIQTVGFPTFMEAYSVFKKMGLARTPYSTSTSAYKFLSSVGSLTTWIGSLYARAVREDIYAAGLH